MTTYNKDQEYTLKVVNTDNEVKEIKYTPDKDMSKPEMIMALKAKYKNFFKLLENKNVKTEKLKVAWFEHRDYNDFRSDIIQGKLKDGRQFLSGDFGDVQVYKLGYNAIQKLNDKLKTDNENILEQIDIDMANNEENITMEDVDNINNQIYSKKDIKNEEYFICSRCLKGVDLDCNVEDYVIDPKTGEEMCRDCAIEAGISVDDLDESIEIENHRQKKLDELHSDIRYDFEEAYKDWGNEVSKTKAGFVNEYMSEFCNDFDEVNWRKYITAIPEVDKIYAQYKDIEDWELPEDVKTRLYELITDYVQDYLTSVYSKKTDSVVRYVIHKDGDVVDGFGGNTYFNDYNQALDTAEELKADDVEMYVYNNEKEADKRELPNNTKCIWKNGKKITEDKKSEPVIVISYGRGTRFPDRQTAIDYYKECVAGTDPNGSENYSCQNILYELMYTDKDVVYDTDDETEYNWWVQKGKPTEDISDELLNIINGGK